MAKKVSADTITEITTQPGFVPPEKLPSETPPTVDEMLARLRANIDARLANVNAAIEAKRIKNASDPNYLAHHPAPDASGNTPAAANDDAANPGAESDMSIQLANALRAKAQFEQTMTALPEGYRLAVVLYSRISREQNNIIMDEYSETVRPRFLAFLANEHAGELKALGICAHGIARMKKGLDPADISGQYYDVSIDHIVERSGCGLWSTQKTPDADAGTRTGEADPNRYPTNHYANFVLMPEAVHTLKNSINSMQNLTALPEGGTAWALMMVPVTDAAHSGFVSRPQTKLDAAFGLRFRNDSFSENLSATGYALMLAENKLRQWRDHPVAGKILTTCADIAHHNHRKAAEMANDNRATPSLSKIFNENARIDPAVDLLVSETLPIIDETVSGIARAFSKATKPKRNIESARNFAKFEKFFNNAATANFRRHVANLPLPDAARCHETLKRIESAAAKLHDVYADILQQHEKGRLTDLGRAETARKKAEAKQERKAANKAAAPPKEKMHFTGKNVKSNKGKGGGKRSRNKGQDNGQNKPAQGKPQHGKSAGKSQGHGRRFR